MKGYYVLQSTKFSSLKNATAPFFGIYFSGNFEVVYLTLCNGCRSLSAKEEKQVLGISLDNLYGFATV